MNDNDENWLTLAGIVAISVVVVWAVLKAGGGA